MRFFLVTALLTVVVHNTDANRTLDRLRTTDPIVVAVIQAGQRRSPTFAALVQVVEQSDALVYVVRAHTLDVTAVVIRELSGARGSVGRSVRRSVYDFEVRGVELLRAGGLS